MGPLSERSGCGVLVKAVKGQKEKGFECEILSGGHVARRVNCAAFIAGRWMARNMVALMSSGWYF